jgi:hypothetical protein
MLVFPWKLVLTLQGEKRSPGLNVTVYFYHFLHAYIIEIRCITNRKIILFFIKASFRLTVPRPLIEESNVWQSVRTPTLNHRSFFNGYMFSAAQSETKSFEPINRKLVSVFSHLHPNAPLAQVHSTSQKPAPMRWWRTVWFHYVNNKQSHFL